ncbi:MAG: hypothetical protein RLZZ562_1613 [Planctomycetota bacterium]|jgi:hypothetical protein
MKRRSEHLVKKRDGRMEFLRATKLARSVHLALQSVGVDEDWRALDVTTAVLAGLRSRREQVLLEGAPVLSTIELASAVQGVLVANGHAAAAVAFEATQKDRALRRAMLSSRGRGLSIVNEGPVSLPPIGPSSSNRLTKG